MDTLPTIKLTLIEYLLCALVLETAFFMIIIVVTSSPALLLLWPTQRATTCAKFWPKHKSNNSFYPLSIPILSPSYR